MSAEKLRVSEETGLVGEREDGPSARVPVPIESPQEIEPGRLAAERDRLARARDDLVLARFALLRERDGLAEARAELARDDARRTRLSAAALPLAAAVWAAEQRQQEDRRRRVILAAELLAAVRANEALAAERDDAWRRLERATSAWHRRVYRGLRRMLGLSRRF
jgi:hypothetical protein